jgi:type II secretory pathway pseudopilin PulG
MRRQGGFTYIGLLLAIALAGTALAGAGTLWSTEAKRDREAELLFVGDQFRRAIASYYETAPAGQPNRFPSKLEDLVQDRRWPTVRRHLRKLYADPITGSPEWAIVRGPNETIAGVHSKSSVAPLKRAGFPKDYEQFSSATSYTDWKFAHSPTRAETPRGQPATKSAAPTRTVPAPAAPPGR